VLLFLCARFAVDLHAYAIMSNHYHVVVRLDPKAPLAWADRLVAERWLDLYPPAPGPRFDERCRARRDAICADPGVLAKYRERLGSLSWLMRLLNEPIARKANREDACTGRFWEGRFESHALLDDAASLSAATYVDLNPVRAGMSADPLRGAHTSIRRRIRQAPDGAQHPHLAPVASGLAAPVPLTIGLAEYCQLLRWSHSDGGRRPPRALGAWIGKTATQFWRMKVESHGRHDWRALGAPEAMRAYAARVGQRWIRGIEAARRMFR